MGRLFGTEVGELQFGIAPGSHVAHILGKKENGTELFNKNMEDLEAGTEGVSKEEIFTNDSERKTKDFFMRLAYTADSQYDDVEKKMVPEMSSVLVHLRDYVTASGRAQQQNALRAFNTRSTMLMQKMEKRLEELEKMETPTPKQEDEISRCKETLSSLNNYKSMFTNTLGGKLKVDWHETSIEEPKDVVLGRIGKWTKSNDVLFPHIPSPNDIKQGHSVCDCYVLSSLSRLAESDPQQIMDMMKDNGDGTVSVRFYSKEDGKKPKPVIVTVNKTVNQDAFGHNNYASSSLWVQMIEKAYVKYNEVYAAPKTKKALDEERKELAKIDPGKETEIELAQSRIKRLEADLAKQKSGMGSVWVGFSDEFMNAISPKNHTQPGVPMGMGYKMYAVDKDGKYVNHPNYYLPEERQTFEVLKKYINEKKEIVTAIPDRLIMNSANNPLYKKQYLNNTNPKTYARDVGLRPGHIYGINKVFEKEGKFFVQIRDPYALFSATYKDGKLVKDNHEIKGTLTGGTENMGTTNLELKDFLHYFENFTCASEEMFNELNTINLNTRNYITYPPSPEEMQQEIPQLHDYLVKNDAYLRNPKRNQHKKIEFPADLKKEQIPENWNFPKDAFDPVPPKPQKEATNEAPKATAPVGVEEVKNEPQKATPTIEEIKNNPDIIQDQKEIDAFNKQQQNAAIDAALQDPATLVALTTHLKQAVVDLRSTDEFFVWTNTENFNKMRDALYDLSKDMKALAANNTPNTPESRKAITEKMNNLQTLAQTYVDAKSQSIEENLQKGKIPSDRAMLRMTAGINIANLCSLQKPMSAWPTKKDERMRTVENDIKAQVEHPEQIPPEKRERFEKAIKQFKARKEASAPKAKATKAKAPKEQEKSKEKAPGSLGK